MRRTEFESLGRKPQEYADIARFSDEGFQTRDKQKIQKLIGGAIPKALQSRRLCDGNLTNSHSVPTTGSCVGDEML